MAKKKSEKKVPGHKMFKGLNREIEQLSRDKGIKKEVIIDAVQMAFLTAAKKKFGAEKEIEAQFNEKDEEIEVFEFRNVVEKVEDENLEITLEGAREHDPECEIGDEIGLKLHSEELGRIAAQTAKQVIIQKIRDAETEIIFNEYKDRKGTLLAGIVRRFERGNLFVDLGRAEAILPISEQVPREHYRAGDRIQTYVVDVLATPRGAQIVVSRSHVGLLTKLFEMEVPEIYEGVVRIESAAREPGGRAKIAVASKDSDVDPVGACVGMKGSRVQAVVQELRGEKIDIVAWHPDPARYVCNAIAPAEVSRVILDEKNKTMELIVADDQLSLAIGKKGQNVRLAARLTGWRIDIHSESKVKQLADEGKTRLSKVEGIGENLAELLYNQGITKPELILEHENDQIIAITGMEESRLVDVKKAVEVFLQEEAKALTEVTPEAAAEPKMSEGPLSEISGLEPEVVETLNKAGYTDVAELKEEDSEQVAEKTGLSLEIVSQVMEKVRSQRQINT